jgi:hypothetical protein
MRRRWVANIFLKERDKLISDEFHQIIAFSPVVLLKSLINTKHASWVELEQIVILRKTDSDKIYKNENIRTIKEVK